MLSRAALGEPVRACVYVYVYVCVECVHNRGLSMSFLPPNLMGQTRPIMACTPSERNPYLPAALSVPVPTVLPALVPMFLGAAHMPLAHTSCCSVPLRAPCADRTCAPSGAQAPLPHPALLASRSTVQAPLPHPGPLTCRTCAGGAAQAPLAHLALLMCRTCARGTAQVPVLHPMHESLVDTMRRKQEQAHARTQSLLQQTGKVTGAGSSGRQPPAPAPALAPAPPPAPAQAAPSRLPQGPPPPEQPSGPEEMRQELLVKWRSLSYRHAQWVPVADVQVGQGFCRRGVRASCEGAQPELQGVRSG